MENNENKVFLTVHGHFYQPPRENPWLEAIEQQDSALPFHDWNERINNECYNPNSISKIVDSNNQILNVVNNYEYMSYNFGPTLLSWMEEFAPMAYERIIKADIASRKMHSGHGNAIAQVYNHMIMPLANERDKQTQVKWGIKDFEYRFGREPEGIWLAETAVDDDTLRVLVENGIKFTILSPFQAQSIRKEGEENWQDVSWGNIDPARSYRYYIKSAPGKYIDLFFYDGAISRAVAFEELLKDGNKFVNRLKDGISAQRNYPQLVHIATDGESYGHHTKFGDMALAYALKLKVKDSGFIITNYAEYLEKYRSNWEVDIKPVSSWSCFHGVGRWSDDCGCSTGGHPGWNQKWRKPLREALDYLRDEMCALYKKNGKKYFLNPEEARNAYINVILDRSDSSVKAYQDEQFVEGLSDEQKVRAMELLEIQRQAMLMYTSCGWFFSEISGIETVQIMKYAARVMQLAKNFIKKDYESRFLELLAEAKSNLPEFGNGKDVYERFVKPSIVTAKQIVSLWAISSLYSEIEDEESVYCYKIKKHSYKRVVKGNSQLVIGHIEVTSKVTLEKSNMVFALLQFSGGDFHCAIKEYSDNFMETRKELIRTYLVSPLTEIIRTIDNYFGAEYFTLKDIFIEERRKILQTMLKGKLQNFANTYESMYNEGKGSIYQMQTLGLEIPREFKISAQYVLTKQFNELFAGKGFFNSDILQQASDILFEAKRIGIEIDNTPTAKIFSKKIAQNISRLAYALDIQQVDATLEILDCIGKLELKIDIAEAQNYFFTKVIGNIEEMIQSMTCAADRELVTMLFQIGEDLNINMDYYKQMFNRALVRC
ncbi:MAG: DUF3536 domain-containing protein [Candidatus Gastranaerophilales bacterium]|nr:DUF3536 domain-containing protein [Candidatus Gastranaerophilales bacterium]